MLAAFKNAFSVLGAITMLLGFFGDVFHFRPFSSLQMIAVGNIALLIGYLWTIRDMRAEHKKSEDDLKMRIKVLEDKLSPKLEIVFGQGAPFEEQHMFSGSTEVQRRYYRIGVKNKSAATICDVVVCLEELLDLSSDPPGKSPVPPIVLRQMNDDPVNGQYRQSFSLNPGGIQYIEVAWKPEADLAVETDEIRLGHAQTTPSLIPCRRHHLFIQATGRDVPATGQWFFVDVDVNEPNERLLFGPLDETVHEATA